MLLSLNQRNVIIDYVKSYHSVAVLRICITALFVSGCNRVMFLYNTQNILGRGASAECLCILIIIAYNVAMYSFRLMNSSCMHFEHVNSLTHFGSYPKLLGLHHLKLNYSYYETYILTGLLSFGKLSTIFSY